MLTRLLSVTALSLVLATVASASNAAKPGTLDRTWGDNGTTQVLRIPGSVRGSFHEPYARRIVFSRGRVLLVADEATDAESLSNVFGLTADGRLDASFADSGRLRAPGAEGLGRFAAFPPNGTIYARAGERLYRLTASGAVDKRFGNSGSVRFVIGGCAYRPIVVAPGPRGSLFVSVIVCVGAPTKPENKWRVVRLLPSGRLDMSYGANGIASVSIGHVADEGERTFAGLLLPQPDGSLVVAGEAYGSANVLDQRAAIARFDPKGKLDRGFASDGTKVFSKAFQSFDSLRPGPGGGFVLSGCQGWGEPSPAVIGRFDGRLAPVTTWDSTGLRAFDVPGRDSLCASYAPAPGGKLVFVGTDHVTRLLASGTPDSSFGTHGSVELPRGIYEAGAVQPDGSILVAGKVAVPAHGSHRAIEIIRLAG